MKSPLSRRVSLPQNHPPKVRPHSTYIHLCHMPTCKSLPVARRFEISLFAVGQPGPTPARGSGIRPLKTHACFAKVEEWVPHGGNIQKYPIARWGQQMLATPVCHVCYLKQDLLCASAKAQNSEKDTIYQR